MHKIKSQSFFTKIEKNFVNIIVDKFVINISTADNILDRKIYQISMATVFALMKRPLKDNVF